MNSCPSVSIVVRNSEVRRFVAWTSRAKITWGELVVFLAGVGRSFVMAVLIFGWVTMVMLNGAVTPTRVRGRSQMELEANVYTMKKETENARKIGDADD